MTTRPCFPRITRRVAAKLGYYVYLYSNSRTGKPLYVGKGKGSRLLDHLLKAKWIEPKRRKEILARPKRLRLEVITHGLTNEAMAYRIEMALIEALGIDNLHNMVRGRHCSQFGTREIGEVVERYDAKKAEIAHRVLLVRINQLYRPGMSKQALYEATRGVWPLDRERVKDREYAMAVFDGVIKEVYRIRSWHKAGTTPYKTRTRDDVSDPRRIEFTGSVAPAAIRRRYVGRSVAKLFKWGSRFPVRYADPERG